MLVSHWLCFSHKGLGKPATSTDCVFWKQEGINLHRDAVLQMFTSKGLRLQCMRIGTSECFEQHLRGQPEKRCFSRDLSQVFEDWYNKELCRGSSDKPAGATDSLENAGFGP